MRMAEPEVTQLRLKGTVEDAMAAVLAALPKDALVRGDDDGVGRFAGERLLVVRGRDRLAMSRTTYGVVKRRLDKPQLAVTFEETKTGAQVRMVREIDPPPTIAARLFDVLGNIVTIAIVVVAVYMIRSMEVDRRMTAIVAVAGGIGWSAIRWLRPKPPDRSLEELVRTALAPMRRKEPKKSEEQPAAP
jgi:hypothetical protein